MSEVLAALPGRPAFVHYKGGIVYTGVHDRTFLREKAEWRQRLMAVHPDHGGTAAKFREERKKHQKWLDRELAEYREYGIDPPTAADQDLNPTVADDVIPLFPNSTARLYYALREGLPISVPRLCRVVGFRSPNALYQRVYSLRNSGVVIAMERCQGMTTFRLVSSAGYRIPRVQFLFARLANKQPQAEQDLCRELSVTVKHLRVMVSRLRSAGYGIHRDNTAQTYQLVKLLPRVEAMIS